MAIFGFEGRNPKISEKAYVSENAQVIGDVTIGDYCFVGAGAVIRGDYGSIRIGDRTAVEEGCIIHAMPGNNCHIESDILLGHGSLIHGERIKSHARLGMGAIVCIGSIMEEWAVLGDGAVLPMNQVVPAGRVFVGNPAKDLRILTEREKELSPKFVQQYAELCQKYKASLRLLSLA